MKGEVYILKLVGGKESLKSYYMQLFGNDLYFKKKEKDQIFEWKLDNLQSFEICNLKGTLIETLNVELKKEVIKKTQYPIQILFKEKIIKKIYFNNSEEQKAWADVLMKQSGYANIFDYYEIKDKIASGEYGEIRCG